MSLEKLRTLYPWPENRPDLPENLSGWCCPESMDFIANCVRDRKLVVELGTYLGKSLRHMLVVNPELTVIVVDHWQSPCSAKHVLDPDHRTRLHELFMATNWDYRSKVVIVKEPTTVGLGVIKQHVDAVDAIYVDASHDYNSVTTDIMTATQLFPKALVFGHDYDWKSVNSAVHDFANANNYKVEANRPCWKLIRKTILM